MKEYYMIFDYFKEAYHTVKAEKRLYRPQIALIIIKTLMIVGISLAFYSWCNQYNFDLPVNDSNAWQFYLGWAAAVLGLLAVGGIISVVFESGLYNMYKSCILDGEIAEGAFAEGVRKYALKFFLGYLLIVLAWVIVSPLYIFVSLVTLLAGFGIIAFIIGIYLTMWKVSMVMNDTGIWGSVKDSFKFASNHFASLMLLQIIHWAFVKGSTSGSNSDGVSRLINLAGTFGGSESPKGPEAVNSLLNGAAVADPSLQAIKIGAAILIPVITIASLFAFLVKMIFDVFFALVLFIVYHKRFVEPIVEAAPEALPDTENQNFEEVADSCGLTN